MRARRYLRTFLKYFVIFFAVFAFTRSFFVKNLIYGAGTSASDSFTRSVTAGWGTADTGGAYTLSGTASDFNVNGSEGTASVAAAGQNRIAFLNGVSAQDVDGTVRVKTDKTPTGSTEVGYILARHISTGNEYRGRLILNTNGSVTLSGTKLVGGVETTIGSQPTVAGLTYSTNTYIRFRFQVTGINPTTLQMKAWLDGNSEPGTWTYSSTDSESVLQAFGSVGVQSRLSSTVTNAPVLFTWDDFTVTNSDPNPTATNTPTPTSTPAPTNTPTPTPTPFTTAADAFNRSVTGGFGTADTGGAYTLTGTAADFNVTTGQATVNFPTTGGSSKYAILNSVSMQDVDAVYKVKIDKWPTTATSGDVGMTSVARRTGSDEYRGRLKFTTAGTVTLIASKQVSGVETNLGTTTTVSGLTSPVDTYIWFRSQFIGTNPTTIRLKAWADGNTEPSSWQYSTTDSTAEFQITAPIGFRFSVTSGVDNAPIVTTISSFTANQAVADTPTPTPTPAPTYTISGTVYNDANGNGIQEGGENGYPAATVTLSGAGSSSTTTNGSGNYSFTGLTAGNYTTTLDLPAGYQGTTTNPVNTPLSADTTVNYGIQNATVTTIASDTFTRSVSNGWGTADTGGAYTQVGTSSDFSTDGSKGSMNMTGTGSANQRTARLDSARGQNIDMTFKVNYDKLPDVTGGNYIFLIGRHISSGNEYRGWLRVDNAGGVHLRASSIVSSSETGLSTEANVAGLTYAAGNWLHVRMQLTGINPTTIKLRAWNDGDTEPSTWQFTTTDSSSVLQNSGSVGMLTRLGTVTNTPVVASFDDLDVTNSAIVTPTPTATPTPTPIPQTPYSFSTNITTVFTIVMENHDWSDILASSSAPYINSLVTGINSDHTFNPYHSDVTYATNYKSVLAGETGSGYLHPSLPNYIWMEAGTNAFSDVTFSADNNPPTISTNSTAHIATLLNSAGKSWRAYQENIPSGCPINSATLFTPRHSPFVYFQDVSSLSAPSGVGSPNNGSTYCAAHEADYSQLATDLANSTVANYNFLTPNLCDDMHDSGCAAGTDQIANGDTWLKNNLPNILESNVYKSGHAVVFVMWDEDSGSTTNHTMGMLAISPRTKGNGYTNSVAYSHSSYVKTIEEIFGLSPLLGHAADSGTSDFADLFGDPVIAAAGDIACGAGSTSASCQQNETADIIAQINPSVVLPLGDNQYEEGALTDFQNFYEPSWGQYKLLTQPSVGNHEYLTASAQGYFDYFNGVGNQDGMAGNRAKGYYSYNVGDWHLIALNTNCSQAGGCGSGSPQDVWLKADLAGVANKCIMAYSHHPRYSSGQQPHNSGVDNLYQDLYDAHADVFLAGHDHNYERFYPTDNNGFIDPANGITEFVVGTGGRNHTQLSSSGISSNSAEFDATTFGVLKMTLHSSSYDWQFIPSASSGSFTNGTYTDSGTGNCHYISQAPTNTPTLTPTPTPVQTHTLSGTVYNDLNENGIQDSGETGYQGATVILNQTDSVVTGSSGDFSFTGVGNGSHDVTLRLPSGYRQTTADPVSASVSSDTTVNIGINTYTNSFQPSAPYYTTLFYNWFKNPATDGTNQWGVWADSDAAGAHQPPNNWLSNYLPQPVLNTFTPSTELYSSNDYTNFKWQLGKLFQAKQETAISSWWGQGDRSDNAFSNDIIDFMYRADNPYPNLRWGIYYECEGNTCNGTSDPSVSQIVSDLNYIATNYAFLPAYLRIGGKPVIFVYAGPTDGGTTNAACDDSSMTARWYQANRKAITPFYIVLKVFSGYASGSCQPDDWHQYSPAVRTDQQGSHSFMVSPGFWKSGETVRLPRDLSSFTSAVQNMVAADATWKIVETWNEWGEGTAVEPGVEVSQTINAGVTSVNSNGSPFDEDYVNVLGIYLPSLSGGAGLTATPTPTPPLTLSSISGSVYVDTNLNGIQDNGEIGYSGATVTLSGVGSESDLTDSSGNFVFTNLNSGTYGVSLTLPSGYTNTTPNDLTIPVTDNTTVNFGIALVSSTPTPTPSGGISISGLTVTPGSSITTVNWTTNIIGDSEINYGLTSFYGSQIQADIDGTTSHSVTISSLVPCTTYHYKATSIDDVGHSDSTGDGTFHTTGCTGNSVILAETSAVIPITGGGQLNLLDSNSNGFTLTVPDSYSTSTSTFQIHELEGSSVTAAIPLPAGYRLIGNYIFDAKAFTSSSTIKTTFINPLTASFKYANSDITGINASTLAIVEYHGSSWEVLGSCTNTPGSNRISCPTSSFSVFALATNQPLPTITPTSAPGSNSSSNANGSSSGSVSPPVCDRSNPSGKAPWLYAALGENSDSIRIFFADADGPLDHYVLEYGLKPGDYIYGISSFGVVGQGMQSYVIGSLKPNTDYYFRVRAGNGCAPGDWSNEISSRTRSFFTLNTLPVTGATIDTTEKPEAVQDKTKNKNPSATPKLKPTPTTAATIKKNPKSYVLEIKITDENNQPVEGAEVTIHSEVQKQVTGKDGVAYFASVPPGSHSVEISYKNLKANQTINISGSADVVKLNITVMGKTDNTLPIVISVLAGVLGTAFLLIIVKKFKKS